LIHEIAPRFGRMGSSGKHGRRYQYREHLLDAQKKTRKRCRHRVV
jgi:hypothetical protein